MFKNFKNFFKSHKKEVVALLVYLFFLFSLTVIFQLLGQDNVEKWISDSGFLAPLVFILLHSLTIVLAPFEGSFLMLASGGLFGFWRGVFYTGIAGFIGSSINFWVARTFGARIVAKFVGKKGLKIIDKVSKKINKHPILLFPLMATTLFDLIGYAAGITKIKYSVFLLAVAVSTLVNVPIYVAIGQEVIKNPFAGYYVVAGLVLLVLVYFLVRFLFKKFRKKTS